MRTAILGTALLLLAASAAEAATPRWKHVLEEDGISVSTRDVPGRGFPSFRGVGVVYGNIFECQVENLAGG